MRFKFSTRWIAPHETCMGLLILAFTLLPVGSAQATLKVLHAFQGGSAGDGARPVADLLRDCMARRRKAVPATA